MDYKSSSHKSKWIKTKWLLNNDNTKSYVPKTKMYSLSNLEVMLNQYTSVYFKPVDGTGGAKIVKLMKKDGKFIKQYNATKTKFNTLNSLNHSLRRFAGKRKFILQKGINLAKCNGKPFDVRIMVQKNSEQKWVVTAIFCKVGKSGNVATNYHQGGRLRPLAQTLSDAGYSDEQIKQTEEELKQLGYKVARVFSTKSNNYMELGIDVAIDSNKGTHILEVNTRPEFYPLKYFKDKTMYNRIKRYAKQYGRIK